MTTNAVLLAPAVHDLKRAGLHRLTISLDTLQRDRFVKLARFDELPRVLAGIDAAVDPFPWLQDRYGRHARRQRRRDHSAAGVRQGARRRSCASSNTWTSAARRTGRCRRSCRGRTCWRRSRRTTDRSNRSREASSAPADRYRLPDGTVFGIIASTTEPFCRVVRSQPADRRWRLVSVPLCRAWSRSARAAARRRQRRGAARLDHERVARPHRSRRGEPARHARAVSADSTEGPEEGSPSGDAYSGGIEVQALKHGSTELDKESPCLCDLRAPYRISSASRTPSAVPPRSCPPSGLRFRGAPSCRPACRPS